MKKKILGSISLMLVIALLLAPLASISHASEMPPITAEGAILIDLTTGEVLWEKNPEERLYPASCTKLMTAILSLENLAMNNELTADQEVASTGGSRLSMKVGEKVTVKDAVYELLIGSCNDLAVLLAKAVSGSVEEFARLMNSKAAELGCTDTHFVNPNGLHDDDHYTSAQDLARIAVYCMKNATFREIVKYSQYTYTRGEGSGKKGAVETMTNGNWLLNDTTHVMYVGNQRRTPKYEGCIGIKTGWTSESKGCLVAAAVKGNTTLLSVVLRSDGDSNGSYERFVDTIKLLDWGFANYRTYPAMRMGAEMGEIPVKRGEFNKVKVLLGSDIYATLDTAQSDSAVTTKLTLDESITAPFDKGTACGKVEVFVDGVKNSEYPVVTAEAVKKGGILSVFGIEDADAKRIFGGILTVLLLAFVIFVAYIVYLKIKSERKKKRKAARAKAKAEALEKQRLEKQQLLQRMPPEGPEAPAQDAAPPEKDGEG